jgi:hypothetical protein
MSKASRRVAEARAKARGLTSIRFRTGDLLGASKLGHFDYIDCCGVLHHLPDPDAGLKALVEALAPGGGMGLMVYAPQGRTGVYALQAAFGRLLGGDKPAEQVRLAREVLAGLPKTNWFGRNELLGDHRESDAGLYDLLLHSRDRPYSVMDLAGALERAGLALVSLLEPARYDPMRYLPGSAELAERVGRLPAVDRAALAENLAGNMKTHVLYAARPREAVEAGPGRANAVPHLRGVAPAELARQVGAKGGLAVTSDGLSYEVKIPRTAAALIAAIGGSATLGDMALRARMDWLAFGAAWAPVHRALTGFNLLHYSEGARR